MTGRTAVEGRRTMEEKELSAAETYSQMFDPYLNNPPYVPEDHAALYFAGETAGGCYPKLHVSGSKEREECEKWRVFTCVYGSLGPPCF